MKVKGRKGERQEINSVAMKRIKYSAGGFTGNSFVCCSFYNRHLDFWNFCVCCGG